jgi:Ser/Thr protein kinase RdoA (MazF antagonist)
MMHLGLMKRFFDTVDGEWRSTLAVQIASAWVGPGCDVRILRASANFVCVVQTVERKYFLRFNHASERSPEAVAGELAFIRHLSTRGVRAAQPLPSRAGRFVESIQTDLGLFHAVLFEALPGVHLEFDQLDAQGFARWGRSLAQLHEAARGFTPRNRPGWQDWVEMAQAELPLAENAARRELQVAERAFSRLPAGDSFGTIHYDFELDNICWDGLTPAVLDFDDCGAHWYAADIAFALRDLFADRSSAVNLEDGRFQAFLRGYRSLRPVAQAALDRMKLFLRWHNLVSFARIAHALSGGPLADEPEWLQKLRRHLANVQDGYRQEFEAHPLESWLAG